MERKEVGLSYLPQPDFLSFSFSDKQVVIITNDGSELTQQVVSALADVNHKSIVLNLPNITPYTGQNAITLSSNADEDIQSALGNVGENHGQVAAFIHLHPHLEFQNGHFTQHFSKERDYLKTVFLLSKHLQKPLNEIGLKQRAVFMTVTRLDGQSGLGKRGNVSVVGGGLNGLVKSLNLEWSPVFCRALDIQPELSTSVIAKQIVREFHDPNASIIESCFSEEGRKTIIATNVDVKENQTITTTINKETVFLVSGGAKGVTAKCVLEMAQSFHCKFILLGRSDINFEVPAYAENESDEAVLKRLIMMDLKEKGEQFNLGTVKKIFNKIISKKEISATLEQIKAYGGQAIYLKSDVTQLASFKLQLIDATKELGAITGIIHGAGRLADKYIQDKTATDFDNVLSVKLDGLLSLLASVDIHQLEHLVLFSSVAGFYGNVGQTDYAIANEILSKAALLFKTNHPTTKVSAINWGAWDSGMVSDALKKKFEEAGVSLVDSQGGAAMMINEFSTAYDQEAQVVIGGTLPAAISYISDDLETILIKRTLKEVLNPFVNHHEIQGNAVLPVVNAMGWMANACEDYYPDFVVHKVANTRLFKGIVFDGNQKEAYTVELKEIEKSNEQITFETTVLSEGAKLPTYHYKATITLVHKSKKIDLPKFKHQTNSNFPPESGAELYTNGALFHGKYFQGIEQILDVSENRIVLSCNAPYVPVSEQGQFPLRSINTFFTDIQYQGMVVWVQKFYDGAKSLPLQTDSAILYKKIPFGQKMFVTVDIIKHDQYSMNANCTVYDEQGDVYMYTEGAALTVSKDLVW